MSSYSERAPVLSFKEAAAFAADIRENGKCIVFTNGCFDLLHPGHLHILEVSRGKGDYLFVGVNTDNSVSRLKGESRPIQPLESRTAILSSLRSVDCVIPFSEDTPLELVKLILPDVLVKGGDYRQDQIVGADAVIGNGGRVEIVPLLHGHSTTSTIGNI